MDEKTRLAIDKIAAKTVQQLGFKQPPILIDPILQELEVNRNFVDLPYQTASALATDRSTSSVNYKTPG